VVKQASNVIGPATRVNRRQWTAQHVGIQHWAVFFQVSPVRFAQSSSPHHARTKRGTIQNRINLATGGGFAEKRQVAQNFRRVPEQHRLVSAGRRGQFS